MLKFSVLLQTLAVCEGREIKVLIEILIDSSSETAIEETEGDREAEEVRLQNVSPNIS
jgi:hypothetical protein